MARLSAGRARGQLAYEVPPITSTSLPWSRSRGSVFRTTRPRQEDPTPDSGRLQTVIPSFSAPWFWGSSGQDSTHSCTTLAHFCPSMESSWLEEWHRGHQSPDRSCGLCHISLYNQDRMARCNRYSKFQMSPHRYTPYIVVGASSIGRLGHLTWFLSIAALQLVAVKLHIFLLLSRLAALYIYGDMSMCNQLTSNLHKIRHNASIFNLKNFIIYHSKGRHA